MVLYHGKGFHLRVTDKHRLPILKDGGIEYFEAKELKNRYKFTFIKSGIVDTKGINLSDELLKIYIILVADGNITPAKLARVNVYKKRKVEYVCKVLESAKVEYKLLPQKNGGTNIHFRLPKELMEYNIKGLDSKILEATKEQAEIIRCTYRQTDGHNDIIYTSKKQEVDLLQHMFITNGYSCKVHERKGHGFSKNTSYQLSIYDKAITKAIKVKERVKIEKVVNEDVWCIQNKNTNFIIRYKGCTQLTGNCHANKDQSKERVLKEGSWEIDKRYFNVNIDVNNYEFVKVEDIKRYFNV